MILFVLGALTKDIREMFRALHACEDVISSSAAGSAPKASLRELVKHTSDAGGEDTHVVAQEREDVWRRAVAHRKHGYLRHTLNQKPVWQSLRR